MIINPKKGSQNIQKLSTKVKRGEMQRTKEYKWLGEWYTENGKHDKSIESRRNKAVGMVTQIKHYGDVRKVGNMAHQVRIEVYQNAAVQTILHDVKAWSKIGEGRDQ